MREDEQRAVDAIRLLRTLVDQALSEGRGERGEDVVGSTVVPTTATAHWAGGMDLGTPRYFAARDWLLEAGALERDDDADRLLANVAGDPEPFKITQSGIDLLRRTGSL
jgi:hypothetical protein